MANLNEYVLFHIFDYLSPLEWICVSEVCQLWKTVADRKWMKITEVVYSDHFNNEKSNQAILAKDVDKMFCYAGPYIEKLLVKPVERKRDTILSLGPFSYKVKTKTETTLKMLAKYATKITDIEFSSAAETEILELLFNKNNIKKVDCGSSYAFYEDVSTESVEELSICFDDPDDVQSFEGHFPNLKELMLNLMISSPMELQMKTLPKILPFVRGLTWFYLDIQLEGPLSFRLLNDIVEYSQLEYLCLVLEAQDTINLDYFFNKLATGCPKLRKFTLDVCKQNVNMAALRPLFWLPHLESLDISTVCNFGPMELPEIINLSEWDLHLFSVGVNFDVSNFCNVIKKMPKLNILKVGFHFLIRCSFVKIAIESKMLQFVNEVIKVVVSHGKDVILKPYADNDEEITSLKISRKIDASSDKEIKIFHFRFLFFEKEEGKSLFENVQSFVLNELESHDAIIEVRQE